VESECNKTPQGINCTYWDVFVGPAGSWITLPFATHGDISMLVTLRPVDVKFQYGPLLHLSSR
jgi:hypothetical protein